jgi:hypothetical protein
MTKHHLEVGRMLSERSHDDLKVRIASMARAVKGRALWPAWSTGETLMVAIVLNQPERLKDEGYTMAEAFNRVDLSLTDLLAIQRDLNEERLLSIRQP